MLSMILCEPLVCMGYVGQYSYMYMYYGKNGYLKLQWRPRFIQFTLK